MTAAGLVHPPTDGPAAGAPAARAVGVTKVYGEGSTTVTALDRVDIDFAPGSFTAIMGPSGSGKSTLMHCLAGLDQPTSGEVFIDGDLITGLPDRALTEVRRDRIGFVFQSFNLLPMLSARDNITLPLELAGRRVDRTALDALVTSLGLADRLDHKPAQLSGGQQQRVAIARALITRPAVVFADEPTGALDSKTGAALLSYLRSAVRELGQTVVMVTHDPHAAAYADRAVLLADGHIRGEIDRPAPDTVLAALASLAA
ncbi:ABC transporter ATP-binding protein [Nakamurella deserti]|uniref:ABC transporter ATP-binding protein n=1 Tax=Nakamurella deserti TaxID=2164074 RepID=UPI000DBE3E5E|nr:ABC transporter ATP-binding protein [Nakamurella deserti]